MISKPIMKKHVFPKIPFLSIIIFLSPNHQKNSNSNSSFVSSQLSPWYNFYRRNEDKMNITDGLLPMLSCPYGHYRDYAKGVNIDGCIKCPFGYYGNETNLVSKNCTSPCPIGTYLNVEGGTSVKDCRLCPMGTFGEEEGLTDEKCSGRCSDLNSKMTGKRYYGNTKGLTSRQQCKKCPDGYEIDDCEWDWNHPLHQNYHYIPNGYTDLKHPVMIRNILN